MTEPLTFDDDINLALNYAPADTIATMTALFALDRRLRMIVAEAREPQLAMIRLAWWRDQLAGLETAPRPADPILAACQTALRDHGLAGQRIADIAEGWMVRLQPDADTPDLVAQHVQLRGKSLFDAIGQAAGTGDTGSAGIAFALADLARRSDQPHVHATMLAVLPAGSTRKLPRRLRPLALLELWARRDLVRLASGRPPLTPRARAWSALWFATRPS